MCGTAAADNAAFCSSCGNSLKIEETPAKEQAVTACSGMQLLYGTTL